MSKDYNAHIVDDADSNDAPSQLKSRRQRKSTAGERKIQHIWTDDEINRLIASVEHHRGLWDFASPEYKLKKLDGWRSVATQLAVDGVDVNEAKVKWSSLRTTYMVNLTKLRRKRSGQDANKYYMVTWKFFKAMLFLEGINMQNSTSTLQLDADTTDRSIAEEFSVPSPSLASEFIVGNQCKCSISRTPTPLQSPSQSAGSSSSQTISILNSAVDAMRSSDTNSTFCDNLLAELRTLSEPRARTLRYKISRLMMDFMEACQGPTPISPVRYVNQNGQDVSVEPFNRLLVEQSNMGSEQNPSAFAQPIPRRLTEISPIDNKYEVII